MAGTKSCRDLPWKWTNGVGWVESPGSRELWLASVTRVDSCTHNYFLSFDFFNEPPAGVRENMGWMVGERTERQGWVVVVSELDERTRGHTEKGSIAKFRETFGGKKNDAGFARQRRQTRRGALQNEAFNVLLPFSFSFSANRGPFLQVVLVVEIMPWKTMECNLTVRTICFPFVRIIPFVGVCFW